MRTMSTVEEIQNAIQKLTLHDRGRLVRWLQEIEDDEWDVQIASDLRTGKLDKLLKQVEEEIDRGDVHELP